MFIHNGSAEKSRDLAVSGFFVLYSFDMQIKFTNSCGNLK